MKSGETSILMVGCAIDDISLVADVIFTIKGKEIVTKSYPTEVTFNEGYFAIPLTQEDTIALSNGKSTYCNIEGQINFNDKSVVKTKTEGFTIKGTLATKLIEGNTPSAEPLDIITLSVENDVVVASVNADDVESVVQEKFETIESSISAEISKKVDKSIDLSTRSEFFTTKMQESPLLANMFFPITVSQPIKLNYVSVRLKSSSSAEVIMKIQNANGVDISTSSNTTNATTVLTLGTFDFDELELESGEYRIYIANKSNSAVLCYPFNSNPTDDGIISNVGTTYKYSNSNIKFGGFISYSVKDEVTNSLLKLRDEIIDGYRMNYIYVTINGSDENGDGSIIKPYATIYHANKVIKDNSNTNRYTIIVGKGTYTDLQKKYSGNDSTDYQGVICKDYVYYESEDISRPDLCVISWDGSTGLTSPTGTNVFGKCPFHLVTSSSLGYTLHTHIKGFTFDCKNTRYALHIETQGASNDVNVLIENCEIIFHGRDDCSSPIAQAGYYACGCGGGANTTILFNHCNLVCDGTQSTNNAWYIHTNNDNSLTTSKYGTEVVFNRCNFNGLKIVAQTQIANNFDTPSIITVRNCSKPSEYKENVASGLLSAYTFVKEGTNSAD